MSSTRCGSSEATNSASWLTRTIAPGQTRSARPIASRDGGSRLLVGSSSSSRLCFPATSCASASFVFSPPESVPASWNAMSPERPNVPSRLRSCCGGQPDRAGEVAEHLAGPR